ncbi:MAG: 16S rRNA (adenine(1518)-N(6)/adenine(1519)-N(6))-dimethyltransferase RsmA [Candidatus Nanohaloarchaea archaeon]
MIRDVLRRHHVTPDTDRDQHFLDDRKVVESMVEEAEIEEGDTVLEVGAGLGTITRFLAEEAGRVLAYENDPELASVLRKELEDRGNVDILEEDFSSAEIPGFDRCVSNIPFHLSTDVVEFLGERQALSVLLVQREFADRLVAEPGEDSYSRITPAVNYDFLPVYLQDVPRSSFHPEMDVDAALVKLFPRKEDFEVGRRFFREVVNALFVHSKKKARNAFYDSRHLFDLSREEAREIRDKLPHSEGRVRELGAREIVDIAADLEERL